MDSLHLVADGPESTDRLTRYNDFFDLILRRAVLQNFSMILKDFGGEEIGIGYVSDWVNCPHVCVPMPCVDCNARSPTL